MGKEREIHKAAKMAAQWWADRLDHKHSDKRQSFADCLAKKIDKKLMDDGQVYLKCDYDPHDLILEAIRETVDPGCSGSCGSAEGILPQKHSLFVRRDSLTPKEGYGNWTKIIKV